MLWKVSIKESKGAKNRNRYNQVPHLTQDTNGKVTHSQIDTTNESQEFNPFPAGDHKAHINRQKKYRLGTVSKIFLLEGLNRFHDASPTLNSDVDQDTKRFALHERPLTYQCIIS